MFAFEEKRTQEQTCRQQPVRHAEILSKNAFDDKVLVNNLLKTLLSRIFTAKGEWHTARNCSKCELGLSLESIRVSHYQWWKVLCFAGHWCWKNLYWISEAHRMITLGLLSSQKLLADFSGFVTICVDGILVFSQTEEQHIQQPNLHTSTQSSKSHNGSSALGEQTQSVLQFPDSVSNPDFCTACYLRDYIHLILLVKMTKRSCSWNYGWWCAFTTEKNFRIFSFSLPSWPTNCSKDTFGDERKSNN